MRLVDLARMLKYFLNGFYNFLLPKDIALAGGLNFLGINPESKADFPTKIGSDRPTHKNLYF